MITVWLAIKNNVYNAKISSSLRKTKNNNLFCFSVQRLLGNNISDLYSRDCRHYFEITYNLFSHLTTMRHSFAFVI